MANIELSIVIPSYNEAGRLPATLLDIQKFLAESGISAEVLVVDDGSTDNMGEQVRTISETFPELKLIQYKVNQGKGYATKTGMLAAQGKHVLYMDADNSTNVREYLRMQELMTGKQVIIASRNIEGSQVEEKKRSRMLISRLSNLLIRVVLGISIKDTQCGFKVFPGKYVDQIFSKQTINRWGFDMELILISRKLGLEVIEFPVKWIDAEDSKVSPVKDTLQTFRELFTIKINDVRGLYS